MFVEKQYVLGKKNFLLEKFWHSLATIAVRLYWPSLLREYQLLPTFSRLLGIAWSCDLHWGNTLVNGIDWRHHQVGTESLSENGFCSVNYTLLRRPKLW